MENQVTQANQDTTENQDNQDTLCLTAGGVLTQRRWDYDDETEKGQWVATDVSYCAEEYLFETVSLAPDVTLADLFTLVEKSPALQRVYRRDYVKEMLVEARLGVSPDFKPGYASDAMEYLELYQHWYFNTSTKTYQPNHHLQLHGVGYELKEDLKDDEYGFDYPAGHRNQWSLSFCNIRDLLALPVRIQTEVTVTEDDLDAKGYGKPLQTVNLQGVSLGQVLHGVFWELSFHGGPEETKAFGDELKSQVAEIKSGGLDVEALKTNSMDELFADMDEPGCDLLFVSRGSFTAHEVYRTLRVLEDDSIVGKSLERFVDQGLVVKPEYAELPARAFRKLFREAHKKVTKED